MRKPRKTIELADELGYVYREYAHYTLLDRAIADVRDRFKPVHRRIVDPLRLEKVDHRAAHRQGGTRGQGQRRGRHRRRERRLA